MTAPCRRPSGCCWNGPATALSSPAMAWKHGDHFETGDFDLLFLDIFMPGMDGLETMRLVHQQQPLIPIIVIRQS